MFLSLSLPTYAGLPFNAPEQYKCSAGDQTGCWQRALAAGMQKGQAGYFSVASGEAEKTYVISDTLVVESVFGGTIDGNGSLLEWRGPPDRPMFLLKNTQQLKITNLRILAVSPLETAFEFTKAAYGRDQARNVAPSGNVLDTVRVEGIKLGNLQYGVRFSERYGIDEDNDQSTIINSMFLNVTEAAISIEHSQSKAHHFYAVKATGAEGNRNAAFVRKSGGSFTSLGGFHGRFAGAVYDIAGTWDTDLIIDENSEASGHLIRTPSGMAGFALPVLVIGGRFAVDNLGKDGRIVDFQRMGPLTIKGLRIDGTVGPGTPPPVIAFLPLPLLEGSFGQLEVTGVSFLINRSDAWDPLLVNGAVRVNSAGNTCVNAEGAVTACRGLAAGVTAPTGHTYASLLAAGMTKLAPGHSTWCEDCGRAPGTGRCAVGGLGGVARKRADGWYCD
jgi:hypothetical protein